MNYYSHRLLSITDCDVIAIQLPEHIKAHYKTWLDYVNEKASVTLSADLTKRVRDLLSVQIGALDNIPTTRPLGFEGPVLGLQKDQGLDWTGLI